MFSISLKIGVYYPSLGHAWVITEMAGTAVCTREPAAPKGSLKSPPKAIKRRSLTSIGFGRGRRKWAALRKMLLRAPSSSAFVCRGWALLAGADRGWGNPLFFAPSGPLTCEKMVLQLVGPTRRHLWGSLPSPVPR